jgi:hypothetical protein
MGDVHSVIPLMRMGLYAFGDCLHALSRDGLTMQTFTTEDTKD